MRDLVLTKTAKQKIAQKRENKRAEKELGTLISNAIAKLQEQFEAQINLEGTLRTWLDIEEYSERALQMLGVAVGDALAAGTDHIGDNRRPDYQTELLLANIRRSLVRRYSTKKAGLELIEAIDSKWKEWKPDRQALA